MRVFNFTLAYLVSVLAFSAHAQTPASSAPADATTTTSAIPATSAGGATDVGVLDKEIKLGVVNAVTGAIASSGINFNAGFDAWVEKINKAGGINGRKISVIYYDDGYEPAKTVEMTKKLIEVDKVFALINYNGTPTAKAVIPIVTSTNIPFLFPRTGDPVTRESNNLNLVNLRPSFAEEIEDMIKYVVETKGLKKIAIMTQADGFGSTLRSATQKAMAKRNLTLAADGVAQRNSSDVNAAYATIAAADPQVVVLGTTAAASTPLINLAKANGKNWLFIGANNNNPIAEQLKDGAGTGTILSQVTPHPETSQLEIAKHYRADMKAAKKEQYINHISFESYINAKVLEAALKKLGKNVTRDGLRNAFDDDTYDVEGLKVTFTKTNRNGAMPISLTKLEGGKLVEIK